MSDETGRDEAAVQAFIEDFALVLARSGLQRMAARMLAAVLCSDSGSMTVREITESLQVSPAAVSGAARTLLQAGFLVKSRAAGDKVDRYALGGRHWYEDVMTANRVYDDMSRSLEHGTAAAGPDTPAGERLAETRDFFAFIDSRIPSLVEEWQAQRDA